ncbi:(2Fe-2S)-binding protein [Streptacidiphilus griseoplanus]|uniref:(2Fe-2S)-binding protein n=1 Tax=Peterkaempfera griseoplana TaxID=66896 RepID=UPI0006E38A78|nr:(2Fe-2S)-binding protein [Peterkaempfera griseoplana]
MLGPYFALERHDPGLPPAPPWQSMAALGLDPAVSADRVATVRALLAGGGRPAEAVERRVAASVVHLGLVARIASPVLALAVLEGRVRPVRLADLRWQPQPGSTFPLSLAASPDSAPPGGPAALAHVLGRTLIDLAAAELAAAVRPHGVSRHIAWGNTASALAGATAVLVTARPDCAPRLHAVLDGLLDHPSLRGTAARGPDGRLRRRSCCLIYRAAPGRNGPLCGDCVLARAS